MSRYNYRPNLTDHAQILILARPFYNTQDKDYSFVLKKLTCFTHAKFEDSNDRRILLKFTKGYSRDTLEWGKLQIHRKPLGFIGIAVLSSDSSLHAKDVEKIEHRFGNLISQYDNYLYDSRCIIIGPDNVDIKLTRKDFFYLAESELEVADDMVEFLNGFVSSLFVILESKRVDKMGENFERMVLPTAPNEQEQTITESDTRFMKKKLLGRNKKILGDLSLISGLYQEAMLIYQTAYEHLLNVNDYLWAGSAIEGMCAASNAIQLGEDIVAKTDSVLTIAKSSVNVHVANDNNDQEQVKPCIILTVDEMISKYSECLNYYKRFSPVGPIELEAHFKFIRILLHLQKKIDVAQVVQSLLLIPINYNEIEKIELAVVLASIHEQLSLFRKAAFFRRRAALYYFNRTSDSKLDQSMSLLRRVAPAYKLDPASISKEGCKEGWPTVQLQVLQDMLQVSRRLGNKLDCVRLLCFILEKYRSHLNWVDHSELVDMLEEYSDNMQTSPSTNEIKDTKVQLIRPIPIIRDFRPKKLAYHLQPFKSKSVSEHGPFIFSSLSTRGKADDGVVMWVSGDVAEVAMVVDNPLPIEIKVSSMTLLTDGVEFEAYPATLALPAQSGSYPFMLLGTPKCHGNLVIKGYCLEVLGVTNTVMLQTPISVVVTPALPILKLNSTLPRAPTSNSLDAEDEDYQTLFTSANLYRGHSCYGKLTLENCGNVPITKFNIELKKSKEKGMLFDVASITSELPLEPGNTINLNVTVMPEESWQFHSTADKIEVALFMTYSSNQDNDFIRKMNWLTYVNVMPSLQFTNIQFNEIERHAECCCISFEATNMTSVAMDVTCQVQTKLAEETTAGITCGCYDVHKMELMSKKKTLYSMHFPRISLPPPTKIRQTLENEYNKFVRDSVSFKWKLSDTNYNGVTYFQDIEVTSDIMKILKPRHLDITINVNNQTTNEGENISSEECNLVNVSIILSNKYDSVLENLVLYVSPHQECFRTQDEMSQLCIPSGSLYKVIKKLEPGESFEHTCGLLFLYEGKYLVDVSCAANQKFSSRYSSSQKRQRAYAVIDEKKVDATAILTPYSPRTVLKKLQMFDEDFWAQSFAITVKAEVR